MGYVSSLAGMMQLYPVADVLRAGYMHARAGTRSLISQDGLSALTPDNLIMMVSAPEVVTDQGFRALSGGLCPVSGGGGNPGRLAVSQAAEPELASGRAKPLPARSS